MIDDTAKAMALAAKTEAHLPIAVRLTGALQAELASLEGDIERLLFCARMDPEEEYPYDDRKRHKMLAAEA